MITTKKILKNSFLLLPLILFLTVYNAIPEKITVFEGTPLKLSFGITADADGMPEGNYNYSVRLFDIIPVKTVSVNVAPKAYVIPSGEAIGVKLYTDGILVLGTGTVTDKTGASREPAKSAGITAGDRIISVNGEKVTDIDALKKKVNDASGKVTLEVIRDGNTLEIPLRAIFSPESNSYLMGLWVRDSAAGIGTLTFYNPQNSTFAALGHGISDCDTGSLLCIREGSVNYCNVKNIIKSEHGNPGEILGEFNSSSVGEIKVNSDVGIFGTGPCPENRSAVPVASRFEVSASSAKLVCDIDGSGPAPYDIEILRISKNSVDSKSFVFKITDPRLMEKTGGIVQGMSGSPVLQDGKLIGAVTHVFVNDTSKGYGIFAENMLDMTVKLK